MLPVWSERKSREAETKHICSTGKEASANENAVTDVSCLRTKETATVVCADKRWLLQLRVNSLILVRGNGM